MGHRQPLEPHNRRPLKGTTMKQLGHRRFRRVNKRRLVDWLRTTDPKENNRGLLQFDR